MCTICSCQACWPAATECKGSRDNYCALCQTANYCIMSSCLGRLFRTLITCSSLRVSAREFSVADTQKSRMVSTWDDPAQGSSSGGNPRWWVINQSHDLFFISWPLRKDNRQKSRMVPRSFFPPLRRQLVRVQSPVVGNRSITNLTT